MLPLCPQFKVIVLQRERVSGVYCSRVSKAVKFCCCFSKKEQGAFLPRREIPGCFIWDLPGERGQSVGEVECAKLTWF